MEKFTETTTFVERVKAFVEKEVQGQDVEPEIEIEEGRKRKRVEEEEK